MGGRFRFLQASDLKLDDPLDGVHGLETPQAAPSLQNFRSTLVQARYRAAERLTLLAITAQVDFVLLAGDILGTPWTGSSAHWHCVRLLRRLEQAGIAVVWVEARQPEFPRGLTWPANVLFLSETTPQRELILRLRTGTVQIILGRRTASPGAAELTIRVHTGAAVAVQNGAQDGAYQVTTGSERSLGAHGGCSGPVQGAGFHQAGEQGCAIVDWLPSGCSCRFHPLDSVRWLTKRFEITPATTWETLLAALPDWLLNEPPAATPDLTIIEWELTGHGAAWDRLADATQRQALLDSWRHHITAAALPIWISRFRLSPDAIQMSTWNSRPGISELTAILDRACSSAPLDLALVSSLAEDAPQPLRVIEFERFHTQLKVPLICRAVRELACPGSDHTRVG